MNASTFRDVWARVWCFSSSQNLRTWKNITSSHISRNVRAIIRFYNYNIPNKSRKIIIIIRRRRRIIRRKKSRKRDRHSPMDTQPCNGFQTVHMFYFKQSITTLWQVNQAWIFFLGKLNELIKFFTQAVRSGFKFRVRFFFLVESQIAVWSLKRMRQLCMRTAHGIYRSCRREKLARIPWFLGRWHHLQTNTPFEVDQH